MVKVTTVLIGGIVEQNMVNEEDYLKVVDENEKLQIGQDNGIKEICKLNKELLKQDELLKEKDKEIERLRNIIENDEETWTLEYTFVNRKTGEVKHYEQNGMLKDDAFELIGMDSDNWISHTLTLEERPSKDQQIEGLLLRCENNEELIQELENKVIGYSKAKDKYKELYYKEQSKNNKHGMEY